MATRSDELIQDLRAALGRVAEAEAREAAAKAALAERRADRLKAEKVVRKIQEEIASGESPTPLFDGPEPVPTEADRIREGGKIVEALAAAIRPADGHDSAFEEFETLGWIGDAEVMEVLGSFWRAAATRGSADGLDFAVRGGPEPAFWYPVTKHWNSVVRPNLTGHRLADAVRIVLGLPASEPEYVGPKSKAKGGAR